MDTTLLPPNKPHASNHAPNDKLVKYFNDIDDDVDDEVSTDSVNTGNVNSNPDRISSCLAPDLNLDLTLSIMSSTS